MTEAEVLFKWLNSQRKRGGAFGSTQVLRRTTCQSSGSKTRLSVSSLPSSFLLSQSTMVVLHALSEYLIHQPPAPDQSLNVDVRISGRTDIRYHFSPQSSFVARSTRVRERSLLFRTSGRLQTDVSISFQQCKPLAVGFHASNLKKNFSGIIKCRFLPQLPSHLDLTVAAHGTGQGILEVRQRFPHATSQLMPLVRVIIFWGGHFLFTCALTPGGDALQPAARG